jgi:hypothetical protein
MDIAAARWSATTAIKGPFRGANGMTYTYKENATSGEGYTFAYSEIAFDTSGGKKVCIRFSPYGGRRPFSLFDVLIDGFRVQAEVKDTSELITPALISLVEAALTAFSLNYRRTNMIEALTKDL